MKDHLENAVVRGFRAALAAVLALALALPVGGLTTLSAFADEPAQNAAEATPGDADGNAADDAGDAGVASDAENGAADAASSNAAAAQALTAQADGEGGTARVVDGFSFGVISDPHYFPAEYQGTRAEAYQNQTSGDLRLMGENEALTTAAVDQMLADSEDGSRPLPKVLLVTGDLTSEGEKAGHEGFAAQMKRLQNAGVTVLVIPGNHDLYNYDAMTFQSDAQVKDGGSGSLWTTEADVRSIYASMGYDAQATIEASKGTIDSIEYFKSVESGGVANCQGGLSYVAKTASGVAFIMVDSEVYSPDWNGRDKAWGQGAGMMSNDLLEWAKTQAGQLNDEGYTVIAGIHHPVLEHQATAETEFITDRVDVDNGDGTRSTDNSHYIATQLADAGIHYVFSGHMHENDVASYTTAKGNVIYDMETGGLCAYPAPYRYANVSTTDEGEIALDLWSVGVEQAAMNQRLDAPNGNVTDDAKVDVKEYMKDAMYGDENAEDESFITRLVMRYAARYLDQLVDIPAALQNIAGLDLYDTLFDALPGLLSGGADVDLGDLGAIHISWNDTGEFNTSGVNLDPSGTAGLLSSFTIRNEDIEEEVQSVLDQIEANYIANGRLESEISKLLENVGDVNLLNPENPNDQSGSCYTLRQLLQDMFQRHNSGADKEPMPEGMRQALDNFKNSSILQNKVQDILDNTLIPLINEVLGTTTIDANNLFGRNTLWHTAVQAILGSDNPSIATVLDKFGLDLFGEGGLVTGLLNQYLTASVYQQIGGLVVAMVTGFAGDADTLDDVVDGEAVQLKATMNPEPNPTVENGALPDQVSVSLDSDNTATSRQFSWYTSTEVDGSDVQMLPAAGIADADAAEEAMNAGTDVTEESSSNAQEVNKAKITLNLVLVTDYEIVRMNHHTATATVPAGDFYYRVGDAEQGYWSEPVYVDGEDDPSDGYTALVVADSQGSSEADYEAYEAVLAKAEENTDNEAFALHLGDMVDDGVNENYWSWLMDPDASRAVATMPVAGNHEARQDDAQLSNAIAAHYNVDIPDQDTSTGLYYSFVYGDATYIVLNTNDSDVAVSEAQRAWATSVADSADTTWKILVTHKAPYSKGSHQNDSDVLALRNWLSSFTTQHGIDLVLSGHDHTYMRTPSLTNGIEASVTTQTVTDSAGNPYEAQLNPAGTTFVIPSTSGTKFYDVVENDLPTAKSGQPYQPIYSTLSIEGDTLFWRSYTVSGDEATLYDSFAITKNNNLTAAEKVMQMIDALPDPNSGSDAVLATKADINEARAAYDELTDDEKPQVSNLSKLEQLEQLIVVYEDIAGKDTVDLSTGIYYDGADDDEGQRRAAFKDAIANPNVGTIVLPGDWSTAIGEYSGNTLNNQYYEVKHNVVIKAAAGSQGFADLRRCGFIVKDGATLVLDDVKLQAWQKKPLIGSTTPMNMIRVENGTLIANGNTSVLVNRDDGSTDGFKDESWRGHAAIVGNPDVSSAAGERAVYLNLSDSGIISGLRDSVVQHTDSSSENDRVYLNGGSYNTIYDGNSSVNLSCQLEINGGAFTKVTSNKDLVVNGGEFNGSSVDYPIRMNGGNLYVKNIGSIVAGTTGKAFHVAGELHIADAALQKLEGTSLDLSAGAATSEGWPLTATATGLGENRGGTIFAVGQQITSMQGMAANTQGGLKTQASGSTLSAMAQLAADQTAYAYAKYHAASGSVLASCVGGNTDGLYAYSGYTMLANPRAELSLAADPGAIVAWDQEEPPSVQLRAGIEPNDATKFVSWESSNGDIATVDENGKAAFKTAGQVTVTAKHVTTGAKATITLSAVEASMEGSEIYDPNAEDGQRYGLNLAAGDISLNALPEGYAVEWTLNEGAAATVAPDAGDPLAATLMRTDNAASTVTLTATLTKDGEPTGVAASKEIQIREIVAGPTDEQVQSLVEVTVSDSNKAENHGDLTSDLLANTTGTTDSYSISSPYFVDNAWKADVTVHAARYVSAYNEGEQAAGEEHELDGADSAKVTLVRSADGAWSVEEGSTNPVAFTVKCDATVVAKDEIAITPDKDNTAYVYDGLGHGFAFSKSPNDSLEDFAVEYRPARSAGDVTWTPDVPVNAGTYDVRVTRAEDKAYKAFEQTFKGGVVIAKADQAAPALEVTPGVDEATIKIEGAEGAHVAAAYEWSAAEDFSNAQTIEGDSFEATASGTYYVRAVTDANHNAGAPANVTLAMVTFDAAGGTLSGNATWLLETGTSVGDANLPTATWNGHGFEGWALADGTAFDGSSVVNGDLEVEVAAQWSVGAETLAPAAPTGAYVAERLQGVSVALHGVNEINSANDGGAHPDVTFAASGDNVQPLIADSFQIGQPAETDGVWTVSVVLDAKKYLEAYAQMGDPAYGAHYFADPDEDGQESFTLAYDKTSRTWKLAEGQQAGYTFDITCLTLRPAELVKYTGGIDGGEVHFPDARVVDGQGNVYTIDQLNALLDEGTTARVAYFDGDGAELADDTVPGVYEARIVVDAATALLARVADQDAEDSVDVNVDGNVYRFSLEPSTLTIRNASDDAAAESGALDVELIAADAGSSDITAAVNAASGGVAAQLPKGTRIFVNDRESGELTGEELAGVRLFSDELLGADDSDGVDRLADLKARAAQEGYEIADEASDFQYLDLVDAGQSNLWVSSTEGATIYWKVPEGADPDSLRVLHFADLHREYGVNAADLQQQIAACAVEEMPLDTTHVADGYVSFPVERAGFSPFVLTWDAAEPDNPDQPVQMATVTFDANGGQLPAGAPASVEVTAGSTVAALPEPVRAGYTFAGWTDASGGPFTSETVVSGSMTVVAQWTANVYPVTLDPQGGAFGDPSQATIRATFGATVGQLPQPSRDGYEFVGWFTQQQGGEQVTASTVYATAASSTYYAQWKTLPAAQAAVTLDANGGAFADGTATAQVMLADGAVLHRSDLPQPSRAGYLLAGWCLDAALTQPVLFADDELAPGKQPTVATEGLVLYAKWLGDLSGEASFSFANVQQAYTGAPVPAVPTFGSGFPAAEQARVKVLYHPAQAGADAWSDQAPRNVGSYDVRFVYGGSDAYAPFEKDYPAGIVIAKATLTQTGLVASPAEVKEGMKLADISLTGATVTSSETGAAVEGAWSWVDADGAVDESGMYQAVFVPTDTANYDLLYVEVPLTVQADEPDQPGSGDEPVDPDRPGSDDKPSNPDEPGSGDEPTNPDRPGSDDEPSNPNEPGNPDEPGSGDEPTDPDEPGTNPDQPGDGGLGTGDGSGSGVNAGSDNSDDRNQIKLVAAGDPIAGVFVGLGAALIAALVTGLVALRNSCRKN